MKFDLHNHSLYSDGVDNLDTLIKYADNNLVTKFALTDHDTVLGLLDIDKSYEDRVIKGIELSCRHNGQNVHIIGLFKDNIVPQGLIDFSLNNIKKRKERAIKMTQLLKEFYNLKIDLDKLLLNSDKCAVTRGNMIRNIVENNNLTFDEAAKYINNDSKAYIPFSHMSVKDGIKLLKDNNCFVILAHPVLLTKENLFEIIDSGFDALEARYPLNTKEDDEFLKDLANRYNLIVSAGSDHHGDLSHSFMGTSYLNEEEYSKIAKNIGDLRYVRN